MKNRDVWIQALGIALLPPIWAVLSGHIGITTGAVALICAGVYAAKGDRVENGIPMSVGFLLGDLWAVLAINVMERLPFPADLTTFLTLFVMGGMAVLLSSLCPRFIFCPAWLCGWAIGLTIMAPDGTAGMGSLPVQIGAAMLAGVWYVGWGVSKFQELLKGKAARK